MGNFNVHLCRINGNFIILAEAARVTPPTKCTLIDLSPRGFFLLVMLALRPAFLRVFPRDVLISYPADHFSVHGDRSHVRSNIAENYAAIAATGTVLTKYKPHFRCSRFGRLYSRILENSGLISSHCVSVRSHGYGYSYLTSSLSHPLYYILLFRPSLKSPQISQRI